MELLDWIFQDNMHLIGSIGLIFVVLQGISGIIDSIKN
jgi:hypothetical protein